MGSVLCSGSGAGLGVDSRPARLYVAWQHPTLRSVEPVARLERWSESGEPVRFEFRYLRRAREVQDFRPFINFPDLQRIYSSHYLFPMFENRLMSPNRADYPEFMRILGLDEDADPFEVLARSEGRRSTDTVEVFPEPVYGDGEARCLFLVHGVRHVPDANLAVDSIRVGDSVCPLLDPQNPMDAQAVLLRDDAYHVLGFVPRYLTELVRVPLQRLGPSAVSVRVEHVGPRDGPSHLRLLCKLSVAWSHAWEPPLSGPEFEVVSGA